MHENSCSEVVIAGRFNAHPVAYVLFLRDGGPFWRSTSMSLVWKFDYAGADQVVESR